MLEKLYGGKNFIKLFLRVAFPVMIQSMMVFLVSLLDTIMVSVISNEAVSAVYASNQITFFFLVVTGGLIAGSGVYIQQFYGAKKNEYITQSFRFKSIVIIIFTILILILSIIFGEKIVQFYARNDQNPANVLAQAKDYLPYMIVGFIPLGLSIILHSSLREIGKSKLTLISSSTSLLVNLIGNLIFIYGLKMGVKGASIATLIARITEFVILFILVQKFDIFKFKAFFADFKIEKQLAKRITVKTIPMFINEISWASAMILISLSYTFRPNVLSSLSIINSITNICGFIYSGLGIGVGILVGATLGAGKIEEAKQNQKYLFKLGITVSIIMGLLMITLSPFIPLIFKEVAIDQQRLAAELIRIYAAFLFIFAICFTNYSTLRVGGQGLLAFLLDGGFMWFVAVNGSLLLAKYTTVSVIYLYLFVQFADLLKALTGIPIIKKGKWAQNLTTEFSVTNELKEEISIGL